MSLRPPMLFLHYYFLSPRYYFRGCHPFALLQFLQPLLPRFQSRQTLLRYYYFPPQIPQLGQPQPRLQLRPRPRPHFRLQPVQLLAQRIRKYG
jgi:hypothetical protein